MRVVRYVQIPARWLVVVDVTIGLDVAETIIWVLPYLRTAPYQQRQPPQ